MQAAGRIGPPTPGNVNPQSLLRGATMSPLTMPPRKRAQLAFASAVILLCLSGLATYLTIVRLLESEKWVIHTYEVQSALGNVDSTVLSRTLLL
jgi:hypothetical protein